MGRPSRRRALSSGLRSCGHAAGREWRPGDEGGGWVEGRGGKESPELDWGSGAGERGPGPGRLWIGRQEGGRAGPFSESQVLESPEQGRPGTC